MNLDENLRCSNMRTHRHFLPSLTSAQVLSVVWQQLPGTFDLAVWREYARCLDDILIEYSAVCLFMILMIFIH